MKRKDGLPHKPRRKTIPERVYQPYEGESDDYSRRRQEESARAEEMWQRLLRRQRYDAPSRMAADLEVRVAA